MKRKLDVLQKISIFLIINLHQKIISTHLKKIGSKCRFYPSCSIYGIEAIKKYGFFKGGIRSVHRIIRCNPSNLNSHIDYP